MKITFKLEHPKRNRSAVSARVYHEKQRYKFATGISVPTALWSGNSGGPKTGVQVTAKHGMTPLTATLRRYLEAIPWLVSRLVRLVL